MRIANHLNVNLSFARIRKSIAFTKNIDFMRFLVPRNDKLTDNNY